jgi:hypothetical protein
MSASYLVGHAGFGLPAGRSSWKAPQREVRAASSGDRSCSPGSTTAAGERIDTSALTTSSDIDLPHRA